MKPPCFNPAFVIRLCAITRMIHDMFEYKITSAFVLCRRFRAKKNDRLIIFDVLNVTNETNEFKGLNEIFIINF